MGVSMCHVGGKCDEVGAVIDELTMCACVREREGVCVCRGNVVSDVCE